MRSKEAGAPEKPREAKAPRAPKTKKTAKAQAPTKKSKPLRQPEESKRATKRAPLQQTFVQPSPFMLYVQALLETEQLALRTFFEDMHAHVLLAKTESRGICADFENVFLYYAAVGVPLEEAIRRLSVENLGGFYARPPIRWYALDDAAKIYPLSMRRGQMSVFRLSVTFKEPVEPVLLQMALTFCIKRFPSFATTVKKGFFWHYLDAAKRRYIIEPEGDIPCRPLQVSRSGSQSFRVVYYENRMSVEIFHILTDGTGGMAFLKTLTAEYLRLMKGVQYAGTDILYSNDAPTHSETANEFLRADKPDGISGFMEKPAVQMSGRLSKIAPCRVLHFKMDVSSLKAAAKAHGATVTAYMLALLFIACKSATDEPAGNIHIQVPVNMRKFYPSGTVRNFSMYCVIKLPIGDISDVASIVGDIAAQLLKKASAKSMREMMNSTGHMVELMRYVPLAIKAPVARAVYGFLGDISFSNTLSNVGVVSLPPQIAQHIEGVDVLLGTSATSRASCGMVTFEDTAVLSITKMTPDPSFEEALYALLAADGVVPEVEGSRRYDD